MIIKRETFLEKRNTQFERQQENLFMKQALHFPVIAEIVGECFHLAPADLAQLGLYFTFV